MISKYFSRTAQNSADKVCLQIKKGTHWVRWTYKETEEFSLKIGAFLLQQGLKKGDCVALILENRPEWASIYLGIMYAGLVCVPLDPQLNEQEIENLIHDSNSKIVFVSHAIFLERNIRRIKHLLNKIIILDLDIEEDNLIGFLKVKDASYENVLWPCVLPLDTASLIYTSGTTALPKGVLLSHSNLCSDFIGIQKLNLVFPQDNFLSILPLYHTYAFMVTLMTPLLTGAEVTYCASFKPEDLIQVIKEAKVTILTGVPQLFFLLHKAIFKKIENIPFLFRPLILPFLKPKIKSHFGKTLRLLVSGGARLEPKVACDLSKLGFKLIEGYGLTETSPVVTINPLKKIKFGSVGKPLPGVQIKILEPDKPRPFYTEEKLQSKKGRSKSGIGEVLIKGPNVMQGYFKQPDLTQEVIKEEWFYSGDLGYIDSGGYLYLVGRKKDVIVLSSGKNIYPEELEEYYAGIPYIKELCILGKTEKKFGRMLDSLYAVIVPNLEYFHLKNEKNIRGKLRWELENLSKDLPRYKHITGFTVIKEELPRTRLKKIKRYEVAQKYLKEDISPQEIKKTIFSEEELRLLDTDVAKKVINYLSCELKKPVYLDSHLEIDLGIDSLSRVELGLGLEALLSLRIPDEVIDSISTVKDVILKMQDIINNIAAATEKYEPGLSEIKEEQKSWEQILNGLPSDEVLKKIKLNAGFLDKIIILIFKNILLFNFRIFWFLRIKGREFIPSRGPYIICSNHASYLDGFFLFSSLTFSRAINTFFIGHAAIFEHPLVRWTTKLAHIISINPSVYLIEAMQAASYVSRHNKIICIFPEGARSISEELGEFKKGIGILAKELNVPVIPVYIQGSHYSWPRGVRFPRLCPIKLIFGKPISPQDLGNDYESIAERLRDEVLKLAGQKF